MFVPNDTKSYLLSLFAGIVFLFINVPKVFAEPGYKSQLNDFRLLSVKQSHWPPSGKSIKLKVNRDTWISAYKGEEEGSNGGASRLKVKGQQEFSLLDIDPTGLKGKIVTGALLHVRSASPEKAPLGRVGISSLASEWQEGKEKSYTAKHGVSSFSQARYKQMDWAYPGSTFMDVVFGRGHTTWKFADCTPPDKKGWQSCPIDPGVIAARVAEISYGFAIYDEIGSEWALDSGKFTYRYFPNRFFFSRESFGKDPWLEIWISNEDNIPPTPVSKIKYSTENLPENQVLCFWKSPKDKDGKVIGFNVYYANKGKKRVPVPRYLIPMAQGQGKEVKMLLQDIPFEAGKAFDLTIESVDAAGNISQPYTQQLSLASPTKPFHISEPDIMPFSPGERLSLGNLKVSVIDLLDKVNPQTGRMIPTHEEGYKGGNHLFSGTDRIVRLQTARNEATCFQINFDGKAEDIRVALNFTDSPEISVKPYQFAYVQGELNQKSTFLPDPLIPLNGSFSIPSSSGRNNVQDQQNHSIIIEIYVPHLTPPGRKDGTLLLSYGKEDLALEVHLNVWNFTLPNKLSFIPEMNAYGTVSPYNGYEYYRLAHEHRTCLNRLPYNWQGKPSFAPKWGGNTFEWSEWDKKVGPLLDGSAFSDLPRTGEPVDLFYLPFNENWPVSVWRHYSPSYWADEAFDIGYANELSNAFAKFIEHAADKGWGDPILQFYLNNKVYNRKSFAGNSALWVFDEPVNTQDFWALRWYGLIWKQAVNSVSSSVNAWYRGDISYSQFGRNMLWGIMDIEYLGGNNLQKTRMKRDEQFLHGKSYFAEYGTVNKIEFSNYQPVLWCLSAWTNGAMGVLPWQTIGKQKSWIKADQTSLFYPSSQGPRPSIRLKAFRRGQQYAEYLSLLTDVTGGNRERIAGWLRHEFDLRSQLTKISASDAGTIQFTHSSPQLLWKLRNMLGEKLSIIAPLYKRSLVTWKISSFDSSSLPAIGYTTAALPTSVLRPIVKETTDSN